MGIFISLLMIYLPMDLQIINLQDFGNGMDCITMEACL
jgi:hypothetical protein